MSMQSLKEQVKRSLDSLSDTELQQVIDYVAFLKFRARHSPPKIIDPDKLATLYAEFADEDRQLAEEGMNTYYDALHQEDTNDDRTW